MKPTSSSDESFDSNDLHWLAFCYVADELDSQARASFEDRLLEDQAARDAVAAVVAEAHLIDQAVGANRAIPDPVVVLPTPTSLPDARRSQAGIPFWKRPALLLTAASLLLVVATTISLNLDPGQVASDDELAEVWSDQSLTETIFAVASEDSDVAGLDFQPIDLDDDQDDWMLAALGDLERDAEDSLMPETPEADSGGLPCLQ